MTRQKELIREYLKKNEQKDHLVSSKNNRKHEIDESSYLLSGIMLLGVTINGGRLALYGGVLNNQWLFT